MQPAAIASPPAYRRTAMRRVLNLRSRLAIASFRSSATRALPALALAALVAGCSAATTDGATPEPRVVDLVMTEEGTFEPAAIAVRRGETVVFRVRNEDRVAHEAYIGPPDAQGRHADDMSGVSGSEEGETTRHGYGIHIPPFGTGDLTYRFDEPGDLEIGCHYPGHYEAGMRVTISVSDE